MPFFWIKEGSNFVAIKFTKAEPAKVEETFATPSADMDTELLNYLKGMAIGEAIEVNLKESGAKTERSLKVKIGKYAKLANREIESRAVEGGVFMFRVTAINEPTANTPANGEVTVVDTPLQETQTEETPSRGRR